eukprot:IDg21403t1
MATHFALSVGFKGRALLYRQVELTSCSFRAESASYLLPADSVFATRLEQSGVESPIFIDWCRNFRTRELLNGG